MVRQSRLSQGVCSEGSAEGQVSLIFANVTADDVLIQAELDALAAAHPGRFRVRPG